MMSQLEAYLAISKKETRTLYQQRLKCFKELLELDRKATLPVMYDKGYRETYDRCEPIIRPVITMTPPPSVKHLLTSSDCFQRLISVQEALIDTENNLKRAFIKEGVAHRNAENNMRLFQQEYRNVYSHCEPIIRYTL